MNVKIFRNVLWRYPNSQQLASARPQKQLLSVAQILSGEDGQVEIFTVGCRQCWHNQFSPKTRRQKIVQASLEIDTRKCYEILNFCCWEVRILKPEIFATVDQCLPIRSRILDLVQIWTKLAKMVRKRYRNQLQCKNFWTEKEKSQIKTKRSRGLVKKSSMCPLQYKTK